MIEILAALIIIGLGVVPLLVERNRSLHDAQRALLLQQAMRVAEEKINELCFRGYTYFEEGGHLTDEGEFECEAEFTAEEISLSGLLELDEEDPEMALVADAVEEEEDS